MHERTSERIQGAAGVRLPSRAVHAAQASALMAPLDPPSGPADAREKLPQSDAPATSRSSPAAPSAAGRGGAGSGGVTRRSTPLAFALGGALALALALLGLCFWQARSRRKHPAW